MMSFSLIYFIDSIDGLFNTYHQCANISKMSGGIGVGYSGVRCSNSFVKGTNGVSHGPIPYLKILNDIARAVDQGGKRNGAFAVYIEPWHADIYDFLQLRKTGGDENRRTRDLFLALWIPDLFMRRVENNEHWSLFCPNEAPGLDNVHSEEFDKLYLKYEAQGLARHVIKAQDLWFAIIDAHIESSMPYMMSKDNCNRKSNQKNLGTIKSSNLCTEVVQYSSPDEISVCVLSNLGLPLYVINGVFDFKLLHLATQVLTRNLDKVIEKNYFPDTGSDNSRNEIPSWVYDIIDVEALKKVIKRIQDGEFLKPLNRAKYSSETHRAIAIGVQGLADIFVMLRIVWGSEEARKLNIQIFETIYHGALTASIQLAKEHGPYKTYEGSPISKGIYQFDMWGVTPSDLWDWEELDEQRKLYGVRNSLLVGPMPTKSTSHILGFNECTEPFAGMIYKARVLCGEFVMVNKYLTNDLKDIGLWNKDIRNQIISNGGSIQNIECIPQSLKDIYKNVWEISMKTIIDMAADRGAFIDQSQSMNLFVAEPDHGTLTSMFFYAWRKGLKTMMYY
jgi:ribonucleoside-diphosphate reductase alpha subunit